MFRMTMILESLPKKLHYAFEILIDFSLIIFFAYWTYHAPTVIRNSIKTGMVTTALQLPYIVIYIIMMVGMIGGVIRCLQKLIADIQSKGKCVEVVVKDDALEEAEAFIAMQHEKEGEK